jgi:ribose transport system ATP-binding protein
MIALQAKGITKRFPGVLALDNVDLTVNSGEAHCVVGENGAGKSTLVKVLTGLYRADEGTVSIGGAVLHHNDPGFRAVAYVPQELNLFGNMTVAENLFLPFDQVGVRSPIFSRRACEQQARAYLDKLQMRASPGDVVNEIPVAEQQLLQVARALANDKFQVLILDEPTASLTKPEIDRLFTVVDLLRHEGKAIVFITHKLEEVFRLRDVVTVLRNGQLAGHSRVDEVSVDWIIKRMTGKEVNLDQVYRPTRPAGKTLLEVRGLSGTRFQEVEFSLREGEILGFAGLVGAGRTEIMQTIFGYLPEKRGEVRFQGEPWKFRDPSYAIRKGLVYLSEERKAQGIFAHLSVQDNVCALLLDKVSRAGVLDAAKGRAVTRSVIDGYNVRARSGDQEIEFLSGGNQQKVLIGRTMEAAPRVLFLDEPTRGIDVRAKDEIYALMKRIAEEQRVGIVLISSELEELLKCANRVITIYHGRIHGELQDSRLTMERVLSSVIGIREQPEQPGSPPARA